MAPPENAYNEIERLVAKFKALPAQRRRPYNEADTRLAQKEFDASY